MLCVDGLLFDMLLMGMFVDFDVVVFEGVMIVCVGIVIFGVCDYLY